MNIKIKTEIIEKKVLVTKEVEEKHVEIHGKTFTKPALECTDYSVAESNYYIVNDQEFFDFKNSIKLTKSEFDEIQRLYPDIKVINKWID